MPFSPEQIVKISRFIREQSGIDLPAESAALIEVRLSPILREFGMPGPREFLEELFSPRFGALRERVLDVMATHETSFFRDESNFRGLGEHILPELWNRFGGERRLRIWCAAASAGQEPYSVAMLVEELRPSIPGLRVAITATDLSQEMVARTREGVFSQMEVIRGLENDRLNRHFLRDGRHWRLRPGLRAMLRAHPHNLVSDPVPRGHYHLVLCRNVLMYFAPETRVEVLTSLHQALTPGGMLMLGAAESPEPESDAFSNFGPEGLHFYERWESSGDFSKVA